jgi:hypothetical protein
LSTSTTGAWCKASPGSVTSPPRPGSPARICTRCSGACCIGTPNGIASRPHRWPGARAGRAAGGVRPAWPVRFEHVKARIQAALGKRLLPSSTSGAPRCRALPRSRSSTWSSSCRTSGMSGHTRPRKRCGLRSARPGAGTSAVPHAGEGRAHPRLRVRRPGGPELPGLQGSASRRRRGPHPVREGQTRTGAAAVFGHEPLRGRQVRGDHADSGQARIGRPASGRGS